jgi:lipoprotein-anchoring transpeptidase ErfK/SrfK
MSELRRQDYGRRGIHLLGLGVLKWRTRDSERPVGTVRAALDEFVGSKSFNNARFNNHPELQRVAAGQAVLGAGSQGAAVEALQNALQDMAFVMPSGVDGIYGREVTQAVKNFQAAAGLKQTGSLNAETLKALNRHAPPPGKKAWDAGASMALVPDPGIGRGLQARVVVGVGQHRAFVFDANGKLQKIYGVRTGRADHPDGRGEDTQPGVKVVDGKNRDPRAISSALWPESKGTAFGTRLFNLSDYDVKTGRTYVGDFGGQELHGTYDQHSIGRDASHGCIGLNNSDIEEFFDQIKNGEFVKIVR